MDPLDTPRLPSHVEDQRRVDGPFARDFVEANPNAIPCHQGEVPAEGAGELGRGRPRWWTPLAISALSLGLFLITSGIMALVALFVVHGKVTREILSDPKSLELVSQSRIGLFIVVVIPQIALVIPSLLAAACSAVPMRQRLGLVRGHWPLWAWLAAAAATPLVGMVSGVVVGLFLEESDTLKQMTQIFREHGQNGFLLPLAFMIGATPAFCEELLFRGYVQTRLTRSFGPLVGIVVASFLFAAFHLDLVHVIAVFPLGLFLGWIAWQSGSLFPAMMGHFVNNVISVVAVVLAPEADVDVLALPAITFTLAILATGVLGMAAVSVASVIYGGPKSSEPRIAPADNVSCKCGLRAPTSRELTFARSRMLLPLVNPRCSHCDSASIILATFGCCSRCRCCGGSDFVR